MKVYSVRSLVRETEKAFCLAVDNPTTADVTEVWFPKSRTELHVSDDGQIAAEVDDWLASRIDETLEAASDA